MAIRPKVRRHENLMGELYRQYSWYCVKSDEAKTLRDKFYYEGRADATQDLAASLFAPRSIREVLLDLRDWFFNIKRRTSR